MAIVQEGASGATSEFGGSSFSEAVSLAAKEASKEGASQPSHPTDRLEGGQEGIITAPSQEQTNGSAQPNMEDEVEYEGKKFKVEKSAKDYLKEMLDAKKGMRKGFSERDQLKKQIEEVSKKGSKWDQIESVFKDKGIQGLYDVLAGEEGAYAKYEKKLIDSAIRKYNATADELKIIEQEERAERDLKRAEIAEKLLREQQEKILAEKQQANTEILMGKIGKAFEDVSFAGKLGDEKREAKFDKYVWEQSRIQLNEYAKEKGIDGHEIPSKVISAIFHEVASDFSDTVKKQAVDTAKNVIQQKSEAATIAAQAKATSSARTTPRSIDELADAHKDSLGKGYFGGFFKELFKNG